MGHKAMYKRILTYALILISAACYSQGFTLKNPGFVARLGNGSGSSGGAVADYTNHLRFWFTADFQSEGNDTPVPTLRDQSIYKNDATATGSGFVKTNNQAGHSGMFGIFLLGSYYTLTNTMAAQSAATLVCVMKLIEDPPLLAANTAVWNFGTASDTKDYYVYTDGHIYSKFGRTAEVDVGNPTPDFTTTYRLVEIEAATSAWTNSLDTVALSGTGTSTYGMKVNPLLGDITNMANWIFVEFRVYDELVSSANKATYRAYLKNRYTLTGY
jgi:hypothetical protein